MIIKNGKNIENIARKIAQKSIQKVIFNFFSKGIKSITANNSAKQGLQKKRFFKERMKNKF